MARTKTAALLGAFLALAVSAGWAEETPSKFELREKFYRLPPGFLPVPTNAGTQTPVTAQSFLEESGVTFPPGAFAEFFRPANLLIVKNSPENLELIDFLAIGCGPCSFPNPVVEFVAWDCHLPLGAGPGPQKTLTPSEIRQMVPGEARRVAHISVIGRSGMSNSVRRTETASSGNRIVSKAKEGTDFQPGEFGAEVSIEPVIGPDGATIDLTYRYRLRQEQPGGRWCDLDLSGDITLRDGVERILHVSPLGTDGRRLVIITRISLKDFDGVSITPSRGPNSP